MGQLVDLPLPGNEDLRKMTPDASLVDSQRLVSLAASFKDRSYRDTYVAAHTRRVLARQVRKFRGERSQAAFAHELGTKQTIISRLENPNYSGWSLRTMLETARKLNVAVFVRFVDFPTFLKYSGDMSEAALHPAEYDEETIETFAKQAAGLETTMAKEDDERPGDLASTSGVLTSRKQKSVGIGGSTDSSLPANDDRNRSGPLGFEKAVASGDYR